jgi:protein O-mannosyl-transferase
LPVVLVLVGLVFAGALRNDFVNWDDGIYILHNPLVVDPGAHPWRVRLSTPNLGYPLPLPVLVYGWLWRISQEAVIFHAFSILVHLVNVGLLFVLLRRDAATVPASAVGCLAFGIHPLVVEPVAWATGLKDLLMASGLLLAMLGFGRPIAALPGVAIAFASKPASILAAVPLAARAWVGKIPSHGRRSAIIVVVLVALCGALLGVYTQLQETPLLRTTARDGFSWRRVFGAVGLQIQHVLAPGTLAPRYPLSHVGPLEVVLGAGAALALIWLSIRWTQRRDLRLPWLALGLSAYAPVSNLRPLERFTADSYVYVPWLAAVACMTLAWPALEARVSQARTRSILVLRGFVALVCVAWGVISISQVEIWGDSRTLWRDAYIGQPDDPETIYRYGDALGRAGDVEEELSLYLEHEDVLERGDRIPVVLPVFYERAEKPERAARWYRLAFMSPVAQDRAMYRYYVEFVSRHPDWHDPTLDDALAYALRDHHRVHGFGDLDAERRETLAPFAERLGLPEIVAALGDA